MEKNVYMNYGTNSQTGKTLNKMLPNMKSKPFEFNEEKRARIANDTKNAFGFSHGGKSSYKKKKKK
jgi:hypothetical protein